MNIDADVTHIDAALMDLDNPSPIRQKSLALVRLAHVPRRQIRLFQIRSTTKSYHAYLDDLQNSWVDSQTLMNENVRVYGKELALHSRDERERWESEYRLRDPRS